MSKRLAIAMSCLVLVALLASACQSSPAATAAPKPSAAAGTVLWTFQTKGAVWASPAVYDGVVFFLAVTTTLFTLWMRPASS